MRRRLDVELVRRGLLPTRARAASAIEEGQVLVGGVIADKASRLVRPGEPIELRERPKFVSRGGRKLEAALEALAVDVVGRHCLDVGASTGGFTDCLLQYGAAEVVAVDVGRSQLHQSLRDHPHVRVLEGLNARQLRLDHVGRPAEIVTVDVSFISLLLVLPAIEQVTEHGADCLLLVKPQFEARREDVRRGGVVRDPAVHEAVVLDVVEAAIAQGFAFRGVVPSILRGPAGNIEFFAHLSAPGRAAVHNTGTPRADIRRAVDAAHGASS